MAPSAALQSRIEAFEALERNGHPKLNGNLQPTPLNATPKTAEYNHEQSILDSDSTSPTADSLLVIPPIQPQASTSRPSSPIALGRKSSLIDFHELSSPRLKPVSANGTGSTTSSSSASDAPKKPQLPPRTSPRIPPLPPRKPSITSLSIIPTTAPPPLPKRHASSPISSSVSKPFNGPSLLHPSDTHTYPPTLPKLSAAPGLPSRHMPSSSTSSFHSVSLSSDSGGDTRDNLETRDSLDGSYEAVSSTAATSPTTHEWEHDLFPTPKLRHQTWQKQAAPPIMSNPAPPSRRPAPPPPQRRVIKPDVTVPALPPHNFPIPPTNARQRYNALFERNISRSTRKGHASGWRGLSVDLLTNGEKDDFVDQAPNVDRLEGAVVKQIWNCSKLPKARLRQIWNECDSNHLGSLDRDAFAKGMWEIDEELRRSQNLIPPSHFKSVAISYAPRAPPPPLRKPNFLLR